ncbi:hypothetical protein [Pseudonocardia spinosispora]|uniref:hypothetical protein n=1 Tax=Pseudonocardia spinosispora TaxID=103441 RepID=UPI000406E979|nr:hypothetical protein [Pseudonocardia spinosispora]
MIAVDPTKLARLEKLYRARIETSERRALHELRRAYQAWVSWADCVRQRREQAVGAHHSNLDDLLINDGEYRAALDTGDPISEAIAALERHKEKGGKR